MPDWFFICENCGDCCGLIPFTPKFLDQNRKYFQKPVLEYEAFIGDTVVPITPDYSCLFLTSGKRCAIYNRRPKICQDYGITSNLPCFRKDFYDDYFGAQSGCL